MHAGIAANSLFLLPVNAYSENPPRKNVLAIYYHELCCQLWNEKAQRGSACGIFLSPAGPVAIPSSVAFRLSGDRDFDVNLAAYCRDESILNKVCVFLC